MMSENGMGAEGAKALSPVLGHLTKLRKLSLGGEYNNVCEGRVCSYMCAWCLFLGWSLRE